MAFSSGDALFGGQAFPALASGIMASPSAMFLGVRVDTVRRVVSLVPEKMALYDQLVGRTLEADEQGSLVV